jgi:hypothetical protein
MHLMPVEEPTGDLVLTDVFQGTCEEGYKQDAQSRLEMHLAETEMTSP